MFGQAACLVDRSAEPHLNAIGQQAVSDYKYQSNVYLMVEGGRIDHAHHAGNAHRALTDTLALAEAVRTAQELTNARDTLIIVTADHSHVFTMGGHARRGNPILGLVIEPGKARPELARDGRPYTTLGYMNGPGHADLPAGSDPEALWPINAGRHIEADDETDSPGFYQEALVSLESETHGGEDVASYAGGSQAHLFRGTMEATASRPLRRPRRPR